MAYGNKNCYYYAPYSKILYSFYWLFFYAKQSRWLHHEEDQSVGIVPSLTKFVILQFVLMENSAFNL